jgi:hypothetical protein
VLHALIEINAVVELAAALADERQIHAVEESQAAADVCGRLATSEIARGRWNAGWRGCRWMWGLFRRSRRFEIERELPGRRSRRLDRLCEPIRHVCERVWELRGGTIAASTMTTSAGKAIARVSWV